MEPRHSTHGLLQMTVLHFALIFCAFVATFKLIVLKCLIERRVARNLNDFELWCQLTEILQESAEYEYYRLEAQCRPKLMLETHRSTSAAIAKIPICGIKPLHAQLDQ